MTSDPNCLHCRIGELLRELHPDGRVTTQSLGRVAQVLAELVALAPSKKKRKALRDELFSEIADRIEEVAAERAATPPGDLRGMPPEGHA